MSWLIKSSIGRKLVMSISGLALILFLTFHMSMNMVALFSGEAYNMVCEFLGANWYALVATVGLAALFIEEKNTNLADLYTYIWVCPS